MRPITGRLPHARAYIGGYVTLDRPEPVMSVPTLHETDVLRRQDPELADILLGELARQSTTLQLIAAENFTSPAVLAALGSPLANKYAEGYPGARHHGGCELVDVAERLAVDRAKALFGAEHANVQSHSGSSAVLAAYAALLRPGDTVLALGLPHGGHLTHGSPANFSGRWFDFVGYGVDAETGLLDHDQVRHLARNHRPKAIVCGSIAYPATSTTPSSGRSPTRSARISSWTRRTRSAWSPGERRRTRCRTRTSCARRPTRCCAGRAAG